MQVSAQCGAASAGRGAICRPLRAAAAAPAPPARRALTVLAATRAKSKRQICCSKTLVARPDAAPQVEALCARVTEFSQQRMDDRGAGIYAFDCVRDQWEPNVFHFWERYESNVALGRHNTSPEVKGFMEQVVPLLEQPVGMALYEWQNGQIGPASVQGGPKGEGGLDDATGASGAAGGASMKQTSRAFELGTLDTASSAAGGGGGGQQRAAQEQGPLAALQAFGQEVGRQALQLRDALCRVARSLGIHGGGDSGGGGNGDSK